MKNVLMTMIIFLFMSIRVLALEVPKSTEDEGMNKHERINKIEKDLASMVEEVNKLKKLMSDLKKEIKEEIKRELKNDQ